MNTENKSFRHYGETRRNRESGNAHRESGNAMIYVIIVIALFAALSFILSRNSDTGEADSITKEKVNINATQIMQSTAQVTQAIEQMTYNGTPLSALDFVMPSHATFEDPPLRDKVFHPSGGGVTLPRLPPEAVHQISATPPAGFYAGRFNDVEWSALDAASNPIDDAVIVAYQIKEAVCARINQHLTGDPTIPALVGKPLSALFVESPRHHALANSDFMIADCPECEGRPALCVSNNLGTAWAYYSLVLAQPPLIDD